jgi:uncharacterized membrane protein YozB (DUF420 family)
MSVSDLPALNASFNLVSTIFISMGWYFIRHGAWRRHMACMITAVISSACFLVGYIIYHAQVGEKSSGYTGWIAAVYFPILASHVLLAFVTLPLVILTLVQVFRRRWDRHKRIARWTIPIWLYVSVTGVLVYLMLYKWFPPGLYPSPSGRRRTHVQTSALCFPQGSDYRSITPSLALGNYLMFDHTMRRRACERIYGHNCHVQRAG